MRKFLTWCSKYISIPAILIVGFIIYILFLQENSINRIFDNNAKIDSLNRVIAIENDTMEYYRNLNRRLDNNDPEIIEDIVREHHDMCLPGEDIYIFK